RPAVRRGKSLTNIRFTDEDWEAGLESGDTSYLLFISNGDELEQSVQDYIDFGENTGVAVAYKCRTRKPWYRVPHVHEADAFLTYMSGDTPKLVANDSSAVAPNSLHIVRMHPECRLSNDSLAALWQTSLTRLSCEIEGHSLGGGMLKIEPTEAENVLVAAFHDASGTLDGLAVELDRLIRIGRPKMAQKLADQVILVDGLGLTRNDCALLAKGADLLRARRYGRGAVV
ncbi:MAG: SAM-dependent methyltransferase, partial [Proteobacteria bacterium]|nr:SAM-dependent methyltransferase [Pseudomonadota bacterium]